MDVLVDLVVVLAVMLGLYGPVELFILAFCAFASLRTGHQYKLYCFRHQTDLSCITKLPINTNSKANYK